MELRISMMEAVVLADLAVEPNASHVGGFRLGFVEESHGDGWVGSWRLSARA